MSGRRSSSALRPLSFVWGLVGGLLLGSRRVRQAAAFQLVILISVIMLVRHHWLLLPPAARWLIAVVAVVAVVGWSRWRSARPRPGRQLAPAGRPRGGQLSVSGPEGGWLPRTMLDPAWVYRFYEWRDRRTDELLPRIWPGQPVPASAVKHLVYIGVTVDAEQRYLDHMRTKGWFHDHLENVSVSFPDRELAGQVEQFSIREAATRSKLSERPRENREFNPTYDPQRCEYMRRRAAESRVILAQLEAVA